MIHLDANTGAEDATRQPADGSLIRRLAALLRGTATSERRALRCVETLHIGPKRTLFLVECDGKRFLAGGGSDGINALLPLGDAASVHSTGKSTS